MPKIAKPAARQWLEEIKQRSGLTWRAFAAMAQTPYSTMMDYRSRDRTPRKDNAKRLGKLLGFDWHLFDDDQDTDETAS